MQWQKALQMQLISENQWLSFCVHVVIWSAVLKHVCCNGAELQIDWGISSTGILFHTMLVTTCLASGGSIASYSECIYISGPQMSDSQQAWNWKSTMVISPQLYSYKLPLLRKGQAVSLCKQLDSFQWDPTVMCNIRVWERDSIAICLQIPTFEW